MYRPDSEPAQHIYSPVPEDHPELPVHAEFFHAQYQLLSNVLPSHPEYVS